MALRATNAIEIAPRSVKVGQPVTIRAKIENKGAAIERVSCAAELVEGAMRRPMDFPFALEPASVDVAAKTRTNVEFRWIAALPPGKEALTFRGKIVLSQPGSGVVVAAAPLDVYVSNA